MTITIRTAKPADMPATDKAAFIAFVLASGEVNPKTLPDLVDRAVALVTLHDDETLIGTAAIKNPNASHWTGDFRKAGCEDQAAAYALELGWVHVREDHRGHGYGHELVREAVNSVGLSGVYATTKNHRMRTSVLPKFGFMPTGSDFPSTREREKMLSLFTRPAVKSG
jgi:predicted N-acetyltransferase YhbS